MAILVEDGSIVPGANSYISEVELAQYAEIRDITLPSKTSASIVLAMDYLGKYSGMWGGESKGGPLPWPRTSPAPEGIPPDLKKAVCVLACLSANGTDLFVNTTSDERVLKREKISVLEFEYATSEINPTVNTQPSFPEVDALLSPLLEGGTMWGRTTVMRG